MLTLLNHVLELSRAEAGSFALAETATSVRAIVDEVVATFEPVAREKRVAVRSVIGPDVPSMVIADHVAIRQVLTNLVANAVKFTAAGSVSVAIGAREIGTTPRRWWSRSPIAGLASIARRSNGSSTHSPKRVARRRRGSEAPGWG